MKVEYTGRHTVIHEHLKGQAEEGLARIGKMLGRDATAHVILTEDKYRMIAEVTVVSGGHSLVATCECPEMAAALHDALAKIEQQAIKQKGKYTTLKRHNKADKNAGNLAAADADAPVARVKRVVAKKAAAATKSAARKAVPVVVRSYTSQSGVLEPHVVRSIDSAAMRPMTFEEAVKESATRDRDVFVFRDHGGQVLILHRKRDGRMELIEVP